MTSLLLNTDSYKNSHYKQYPPGTKYISSYIESRGGEYDFTLFFGLQMFLSKLATRINIGDVNYAKERVERHGLPFNYEGWKYIVTELGGRLPLQIDAVAEGTVLPTKNVLVQVMNTDPNVPWLTSFIETALLRAVWYPTTVATRSKFIKNLILSNLERTSDNPEDQIPFKLHDFGARGVSSEESAGIGGLAHLVNFMGTDTMTALEYAYDYYDCDMAGYSIPAAEHSTITSWGRANEAVAYRNMLQAFPNNPLVAVVSDSWNIYNAVSEIWGKQLKDEVLNFGGTLVIRPDSGDPRDVVVDVVRRLADKFGYTINNKGYKVLPVCVRVILGDGVNEDSIQQIMIGLIGEGFSIDNIAFGMGGELLQTENRDTLKFAMKASAISSGAGWTDVYKDPATDPGKASKRGRLALAIDSNGKWETVRQEDLGYRENYLRPVFRNGQILRHTTLDMVRELSNRKD